MKMIIYFRLFYINTEAGMRQIFVLINEFILFTHRYILILSGSFKYIVSYLMFKLNRK